MSGTCVGCRYNHRDVKCPPCDLNYSGFEKELRSAEKTLLDEFAIAAMQGICANVPLEKFAQDVLDEKYDNERQNNAYAFVAYSYAAAMMRERARRDEMGNAKEANT